MGHGEKSDSAGIDATTASVARMYDYYLGGTDNFAVDREACAALSEIAPSTQALARNNRLFLQRAVRTLAREYGVRQFLDHGSGLPTRSNVHQVAQGVDPAAKVVYVDNDPIVLAHARSLLDANDRTTVIGQDMRDPDAILDHPEAQALLDYSRPVAVLFVSVLHCLPDTDEPAGILHRIISRLAPGSFLVLSHLVSEDDQVRRQTTELMLSVTGGRWGRVREPREVEVYFTGLDPLPPGLVEVSTWRPDTEVAPRQRSHEWIEYGGVARLP
ncbi:SAM-dependent methyltransferase [Streptomyces sp. NPDC054796]